MNEKESLKATYNTYPVLTDGIVSNTGNIELNKGQAPLSLLDKDSESDKEAEKDIVGIGKE